MKKECLPKDYVLRKLQLTSFLVSSVADLIEFGSAGRLE